ncbi:MAG: hypothetical protein ABSH00_16110 [Bryobacteraceae bacterium]|jgi:hypothetical protein
MIRRAAGNRNLSLHAVIMALVLAVLEKSCGWFERLPEAPAWV